MTTKENVTASEARQSLTSKAFTLAEVLITLVVIGVIAAITVPMIHANYKKQETISKLKKTYSSLSQLVNRAQIDNGSIEEWYENNKNSRDLFATYFKPYLRNAKTTKELEVYDTTTPYKKLSGEKIDITVGQTSNTRTSFMLDDGVFVMILTATNAADGSGVDYQSPFYIYVDINAGKKPNIQGKDVFRMMVTKNQGLKALGTGESDSEIEKSCSRNNNGSGSYCLEKIMRDGWEIKEDYPW